MSNITIKSTKQEILDAYLEAQKKLQAKSSLVEDPMKAIRQAESAQVAKDAQDIVDSGILNPELTEKWNNLNKAIAEKETELKELYGITREAETMAAMINANKTKKFELEEAYKEKGDALVADYNEKKMTLEKNHAIAVETLKEQRDAATKEFKKYKEDLEASIIEQKATAAQNRRREEQEYQYDLNRARKLERDKYNDEVAKREAAIAEKEAMTQKLLSEAQENAETTATYIAELEAKVATFPETLAKATAEAETNGKKAAGKEYGYEKALYMKEKEYELKTANDACKRAEDALKKAEAKVAELTVKLDESYARMQELASTTVKSNGGVKILDRESSNNK